MTWTCNGKNYRTMLTLFQFLFSCTSCSRLAQGNSVLQSSRITLSISWHCQIVRLKEKYSNAFCHLKSTLNTLTWCLRKSLSKHIRNLLPMHDNLLKAPAKDLLRAAFLWMTSKEPSSHKEYPICPLVVFHYHTCLPPSCSHTFWFDPMIVISSLTL